MSDALGAFSIEPISESLLLIRFGAGIDATINARVHAALRCLADGDLPGIRDLVPAYATLAVVFDPRERFDPLDRQSPVERLAAAITNRLSGVAAPVAGSAHPVEIPVCYDESLAPDLATAAACLGMSAGELARRHAAADYRVAMLGFAPGFPYLLGLDPGLQLPRRDQPRLCVKPGSVAIGGSQTGIYPTALPGGWHLIGRTPWRLFDLRRSPPNRLAAGDAVRFVAIDRDRFDQLDEHAA